MRSENMMHHIHRLYKESFSFNFKIQRTDKMRKGKSQQCVTMTYPDKSD